MPTSTLVIVIGAWALLALLSVMAYRFNRGRVNPDEDDEVGKRGREKADENQAEGNPE
jgi:hypothetical protein